MPPPVRPAGNRANRNDLETGALLRPASSLLRYNPNFFFGDCFKRDTITCTREWATSVQYLDIPVMASDLGAPRRRPESIDLNGKTRAFQLLSQG